MSSPGPTPLDLDMFSEMDDSPSPLYTPIIPTSPVLHGPPSGFQMVPLPEHPSQAFECDVGGIRVRSPFFTAFPLHT
jgi:hypothetical protein